MRDLGRAAQLRWRTFLPARSLFYVGGKGFPLQRPEALMISFPGRNNMFCSCWCYREGEGVLSDGKEACEMLMRWLDVDGDSFSPPDL